MSFCQLAQCVHVRDMATGPEKVRSSGKRGETGKRANQRDCALTEVCDLEPVP